MAADGTLTYTPSPNVSGMLLFTFDVQDAGGTANGGQDTSAAQTYMITVSFANQPPSFTASNPPAVDENTGTATVANWATFDPNPLCPARPSLAIT